MAKPSNEYYLPEHTIVEVIKIWKGRYWKKEMTYAKALKLIEERRKENKTQRFRIYQLGYSQFKT